jgi:hypothetical protein
LVEVLEELRRWAEVPEAEDDREQEDHLLQQGHGDLRRAEYRVVRLQHAVLWWGEWLPLPGRRL